MSATSVAGVLSVVLSMSRRVSTRMTSVVRMMSMTSVVQLYTHTLTTMHTSPLHACPLPHCTHTFAPLQTPSLAYTPSPAIYAYLRIATHLTAHTPSPSLYAYLRIAAHLLPARTPAPPLYAPSSSSSPPSFSFSFSWCCRRFTCSICCKSPGVRYAWRVRRIRLHIHLIG